jgi:hypothetical protein
MRSPYLVAFLNPLNLAMLALSVAAGLCSAWWLFPLGLLLWLVMFFVVARDPALRVAIRREARTATLSPRFQGLFDDVSRAQSRLFNTLSTADRRTQDVFAPVHDEVEKLAEAVYTVCQRMTGPENYLKVSTANSDLEGERALAFLALEAAADPKEKLAKQEALDAVDERIRSTKAVDALLGRVETQLRTVSNELNAVLGEIVRLQALGARDTAEQVPALLQRIRGQSEELKAFEAEAARY